MSHETDDTAVREALKELADAESAYRLAHDVHGDGSPKAGRAWDLLRRAGDHARQALAEPPVNETPISEHEDGDVSGERTCPADYCGIAQMEDDR